MRKIFISLFVGFVSFGSVSAQTVNTSVFSTVAGARLQPRTLVDVCPIDDPLTKRLLTEYGAIFVASQKVVLPYKCILEREADVQAFQAIANPRYQQVGGVTVTLQEVALVAFLAARAAAAKEGVAISVRGGSTASTRDYAKTVALWESRFHPALLHWSARGRITKADADRARQMPMREQIATVFGWEERKFGFVRIFLNRSYIRSRLQERRAQFHARSRHRAVWQCTKVRKISGDHGWFQTVKSDLPHFTYLGRTRDELQSLGLKREVISGQEFWIPNME
ncbi:MAG: hypothetical protein IPO41_13110 [Acidobacteria bacterium]|nr:hypothetical protein [Acidobacteriota bacterium]